MHDINLMITKHNNVAMSPRKNLGSHLHIQGIYIWATIIGIEYMQYAD